MLPLSPTTAHRCEVDYASSLPLLSPAPLSTAKKEIIQFQLFFYKHPPPLTPPSPTAGRGTQTTTLPGQTLIVCACVCIFPPDMKKETK